MCKFVAFFFFFVLLVNANLESRTEPFFDALGGGFFLIIGIGKKTVEGKW